MQTNFIVSGMHCVSCKRLLEDVCTDVAGVEKCVVDVENGTAQITHSESCDLEAVMREVNGLGDYTMTLVS